MSRIAGLMVFALIAVIWAAAEDTKAPGTEMTGWVCNAKCVKQDADKASCDTNCKEKAGDLVFVDDQGKSFKVVNQKMAKEHSGNKVKMMGTMNGDSVDPKQILDLNAYGPG